MRWGRVVESSGLIGAIAVFLFLSLHQLDLPGLYYDEAADAVPAMQIVLGQPVDLSRGVGLTLFGRTWPLMVMDYVGSVSTYLLVPSISLLGVRVEAVRALPIVGGALTLLFGYGFLRAIFGPAVALPAIWLTAVSPSFVFWTRQGIHVSSLMTVCSSGALWLLAGWWRGGRTWRLVPAAALLGLGISVKLLFLWFPVALAGCAAVLGLPGKPDWSPAEAGSRPGPSGSSARRRRALPYIGWRDLPALAMAIVAFLLGAGFIILYNLQSGGTIQILQENAIRTSSGVDNREFLANLATRLDTFASALRGDHLWYLGGVFANPLAPFAAICALVLLTVLVIVDSTARREWRRAAFLVLLIGIMVAESTITVSGIFPTHFYLFYPLPQAGIALAGVWLARFFSRFGRVAAAAGVGLGMAGFFVLAGWDLLNDFRYQDALTLSGGYNNHSDGLVDLSDYLVEWKGHNPVAMDWGISKSVQFLSKGRVNPPELFGYWSEPDSDFVSRLQPYLAEPYTLYLFHSEDKTVFTRFPLFLEAARATGRTVHRDLVVTQRDGTLLFRAYTVR